MRALVEFKGGTICLLDDGQIYIAASDPAVSPEVAALRLPVGTGLAGLCIQSGEPVYSPDLDNDPRVDQKVRKLGSNSTMKSYLVVPLVCLGEVTGLMQIDSVRANAYDEDDVRILEGLAAQVAGAIESARRYEEIVRLEHLKSDFIARVSHELRTPLTVIVASIPILREYGDRIDETTRADLLARLQHNADRLRELIEELLSVTTYEAGMETAIPSDQELMPVFERIRNEALRPEAVTIRADGGLHAMADGRILRHILALLVDNALKYAGDAAIEARATEEGAILIDVRDHGPGIDPVLRDRIFERFVRGDDSTPGMGLGLPLARTLVSTIGGRLDVVDQLDGGACFRITLPPR